VVSVYALTA